MGVLTTLYEIEGEFFESLKKKRRLRSMVDVFNGHKPPETIGLESENSIRTAHLDQGWDDIEIMLRSVAYPDQRWNPDFYKENYFTIKHPSCHAFYWPPVNADGAVLTGIRYQIMRFVHFDRGFTKENWEDEFPLFEGEDEDVILVDSLKGQFEYLQAYILNHLPKKKPPRTTSGQEFDESMVNYCLKELRTIVQFFLEALYRPEDDDFVETKNVVVGIQV